MEDTISYMGRALVPGPDPGPWPGPCKIWFRPAYMSTCITFHNLALFYVIDIISYIESHPKSPPGSPKTLQNAPKSRKNDTSNPNFQKTGNLMKTLAFIMFSTHPASQRTSHFLTKPLRKQAPDPDLYFHVQNHKIVSNLSPKWSPRESQNPLTITKNPSLDLKVSREVSLWLPGSPQWMPKVLKWSPRVFKITVLGIKTVLSSRHPIKSRCSQKICCCPVAC